MSPVAYISYLGFESMTSSEQDSRVPPTKLAFCLAFSIKKHYPTVATEVDAKLAIRLLLLDGFWSLVVKVVKKAAAYDDIL